MYLSAHSLSCFSVLALTPMCICVCLFCCVCVTHCLSLSLFSSFLTETQPAPLFELVAPLLPLLAQYTDDPHRNVIQESLYGLVRFAAINPQAVLESGCLPNVERYIATSESLDEEKQAISLQGMIATCRFLDSFYFFWFLVFVFFFFFLSVDSSPLPILFSH